MWSVFCKHPFTTAKNLKYSCYSHFNQFFSNSSLLLCSVIDLFSLHKSMQSMPRCNQAYSKCEYILSCLLLLFSHQNGSESFKLILDLFLLSWSITGKICHFQNSFWIPFCEEKISGNTKVDFAEGQIVPRNTSFEQNI